MMNESLFFRLLPIEDKAEALAQSVAAVREGRKTDAVIHAVNPASFRQVPGSPFAYWVSERIRRLFTELPSFESDGRTVKQGLATADDFRFVRAWWEVAPERIVTGTMETTPEQFRQQTFASKRWVPFAKGGEYSPYYADLHLVVNWEKDGEEIRNFVDPKTGRTYSRPQNTDFYFRPGLTWTQRTQKGINVKPLPSGTIHGHKGSSGFSNIPTTLPTLISLMNTNIFRELVELLTCFGSFNEGVIKRVVVPKGNISEQLALQAVLEINIKRSLDIANENSHVFQLPTLLQVTSDTLSKSIMAWQTRLIDSLEKLTEYQREVDNIAYRIYNVEREDLPRIEKTIGNQSAIPNEREDEKSDDSEETEETEETEEQPSTDHHTLITDLLSYTIGCIYGRWDIRFATKEKQAPELPDPFAPLPACSPGMLTGEDGLPLHETPPQYPLRIDWDGILVDDPEHADDLVHRVREVFEVIWKDRAEAIETEACEILGIKELREYFRKPGNGGFWMDHVKRYSKSRRKAPIYWLLQSSKKNYALWLYYQRLDKDILFKALINYVEPKIRLEQNRLDQLRSQRAQAGTAGREAKQLEKQLDRQEYLLSDLHDFRDKLRRAADLHLEPNLDDGVVLNLAPLWELVPWSEAKKYWEELLAGKYEWSFVDKQLREKGLVESNG